MNIFNSVFSKIEIFYINLIYLILAKDPESTSPLNNPPFPLGASKSLFLSSRIIFPVYKSKAGKESYLKKFTVAKII